MGIYNCNNGCGCHSGCSYNNRRSGNYGVLNYLRSGSCTNTCTNGGSCGDCTNCGCGGRCNAYSDYPGLTGCSGSRIFYTGACGCAENSCNNCGGINNCNNCSGCYNCGGCGSCNGCGNCGGDATPYGAAAEFVAAVPQNICAGNAVVFSGECDTDGCFSSEHCGIRINRAGRYVAIYSMASSACDNAATMLSLALNGSEMYASRSYMSPAVRSDSRHASGQAVFCAHAGDVLTLNTSVALNIPHNGASCPLATLVIWRIN